MNLVFDLETDGFLAECTKMHCITIKDVDGGKVLRYHEDKKMGRDGTLAKGVKMIEEADLIVGHNIIPFDIPVIQKFYPAFKPSGLIRDTLICAKLIWPREILRKRDFANIRRKKCPLPEKMAGLHSLKSWGYRLVNYKGDYTGGWETFNQEMLDYGVQDVEVTLALWKVVRSLGVSEDAIQIEHDMNEICLRQTNYGFSFNVKACAKLFAELQGRLADIEPGLMEFFPPMWKSLGIFKPKRTQNRKVPGWTHKELMTKYNKETREGAFTKVKLQKFNPDSGDQIAARLIRTYGWEPMEFTKKGKPKTDEDSLKGLTYPGIPQLLDYLMVNKRLEQVGTGKQSWLKVEKDGVIHGKVDVSGAITGRMSHSNPNQSQVPKVSSPYGPQCRSLFRARPGKVLVGCDASGLELRVFGNYLAKYDGGEYAKAVVEGDIHTINQVAAGFPPGEAGRDNAKTFIYALLYGAGNGKLGKISNKGAKHGKRMRDSFMEKIPAFKKLVDAVGKAVDARGYVFGPDGRKIYVRAKYSALNTLFQGAGAIIMKKACQMLDATLQTEGLVPGQEYEFVANSHDEWQIETDPDVADMVGGHAVASIKAAGVHFKLHVPLDAKYKIGMNWAETH